MESWRPLLPPVGRLASIALAPEPVEPGVRPTADGPDDNNRSITAIHNARLDAFHAADSLETMGLPASPTLSANISNVLKALRDFGLPSGTSLPVHVGGPNCGPSPISATTPRLVSYTIDVSLRPNFAHS